ELRKITSQRLQVTALNQQLVAVPEDKRSKSVPLRLIQPARALRQVPRQLRKHWSDRRLNPQLHSFATPLPISTITSGKLPARVEEVPQSVPRHAALFTFSPGWWRHEKFIPRWIAVPFDPFRRHTCAVHCRLDDAFVERTHQLGAQII